VQASIGQLRVVSVWVCVSDKNATADVCYGALLEHRPLPASHMQQQCRAFASSSSCSGSYRRLPAAASGIHQKQCQALTSSSSSSSAGSILAPVLTSAWSSSVRHLPAAAAVQAVSLHECHQLVWSSSVSHLPEAAAAVWAIPLAPLPPTCMEQQCQAFASSSSSSSSSSAGNTLGATAMTRMEQQFHTSGSRSNAGSILAPRRAACLSFYRQGSSSAWTPS
jgi:hypothetical protein